jgi:hypothetical protein
MVQCKQDTRVCSSTRLTPEIVRLMTSSHSHFKLNPPWTAVGRFRQKPADLI